VSLSHHLAAVWFADVVGYTRLSEENEGEAVRLVHGFQRVAREVVARYDGRVVKFLGDGALAEFSSTDMAVRSAEALIRAFAAAAAAEGLGSGELRVGVHVGDVVATEDGDVYGDGVNVASRIQAAGDPGEVWVSEDVRRQLRQRPEFRFESDEEFVEDLETTTQDDCVELSEIHRVGSDRAGVVDFRPNLPEWKPVLREHALHRLLGRRQPMRRADTLRRLVYGFQERQKDLSTPMAPLTAPPRCSRHKSEAAL